MIPSVQAIVVGEGAMLVLDLKAHPHKFMVLAIQKSLGVGSVVGMGMEKNSSIPGLC